jgi:hypothetical protein
VRDGAHAKGSPETLRVRLFEEKTDFDWAVAIGAHGQVGRCLLCLFVHALSLTAIVVLTGIVPEYRRHPQGGRCKSGTFALEGRAG